jgi:predicted enzyme related to lactoylglutathione lyase/catechol 2,3-dioxygenase-like lactoylglutathione lyase family enzyme
VSLRLRILQIDVPASRLDESVAFWTGALGAIPVPSPGGFVHLNHARSVVEVHLQPLAEGDARYHLDLEAAGPEAASGIQPDRIGDRGAEVARLVGLGAGEGPSSDDGYTVVHDPAGLPLCVIDPGASPRNPLGSRRPDRGYLDAIFLDVPSDAVDAEVAFWEAALEAEVRRDEAGDVYVPLGGVVGPGGPIHLEVQRIEGPPRVHVDLSVADVDAEAARLEALGATRVGAVETWITFADPVGNLLCVVAL